MSGLSGSQNGAYTEHKKWTTAFEHTDFAKARKFSSSLLADVWVDWSRQLGNEAVEQPTCEQNSICVMFSHVYSGDSVIAGIAVDWANAANPYTRRTIALKHSPDFILLVLQTKYVCLVQLKLQKKIAVPEIIEKNMHEIRASC